MRQCRTEITGRKIQTLLRYFYIEKKLRRQTYRTSVHKRRINSLWSEGILFVPRDGAAAEWWRPSVQQK
jgi:hypothetical protein